MAAAWEVGWDQGNLEWKFHDSPVNNALRKPDMTSLIAK